MPNTTATCRSLLSNKGVADSAHNKYKRGNVLPGAYAYQMRLATLAMLLVPLLTLGALGQAAEGSTAAESVNPLGVWRGELQRKSESRVAPLQIVLRVRKGTDGQLTATLDGLGRNLRNLVVENLILIEDVLSFQIMQVQGRFAGNFSPVGDSLRGRWSEGDESWPLILFRD
jgi:hypothetical protein